jgi:hypothetical protein
VIDRRSFIGALVRGIVIVPLAVSAQTATPVRRIGWLVLDDLPTLEEFKQMLAPLRELGWIEGHNLIVERRSADGRPERLQSLAEDLVRLKVELIVTSGTAAALAAKLATDTIPIVMRFRRRPGSRRTGCEPFPARWKYHWLFRNCPGRRRQTPRTVARTFAGAATRRVSRKLEESVFSHCSDTG